MMPPFLTVEKGQDLIPDLQMKAKKCLYESRTEASRTASIGYNMTELLLSLGWHVLPAERVNGIDGLEM